MKLVNIFLRDPCISWHPIDRWKFKGDYGCTDEFAEDFCEKEKFKLVKKEVEIVGSALIVHLTLKSIFSINHPDSNQALYNADAVLVRD